MPIYQIDYTYRALHGERAWVEADTREEAIAYLQGEDGGGAVTHDVAPDPNFDEFLGFDTLLHVVEMPDEKPEAEPVVLPDGKVTIIHICVCCGSEAHWMPSDFAEKGTPICGNMECEDEGEDMIYHRTEMQGT